MNDITVYENNRFGRLRTSVKDGDPWFVATDVCKALEIGNPSQALSRLDSDEKMTTLISNDSAASGKSKLSFVSESGLYSLVLGSRKPEARQFKRWVTHEVLPAIRKTGAYVTPSLAQQIISDPDTLFLVLEQLRQERTQRIEAELRQQKTDQRLLSLQSRLDSIKSCPVFLFPDDPEITDCCSVGELAMQLSSPRRKISRQRLYTALRNRGYIRPESPLPTTKGIESGFFRVMEKRCGSHRYYVTAVTLAGQLYFTSLFI